MMITFISDEKFVNTRNAVEKGYPQVVMPVKYFVGSIYPNIVGYTSFSDMGKFYFVGNTYIVPEFRGNGFYKELLSTRNKHLNDKPKITLVNPIEDTNVALLHAQVEKQGGVRVENYKQVCDIMVESLFSELKKLEVFIYR